MRRATVCAALASSLLWGGAARAQEDKPISREEYDALRKQVQSLQQEVQTLRDQSARKEHVDELVARDLAFAAGDAISATSVGIEAHGRFTERVAQNAPKLYGDIPDEDLAITRRVLETVTARANRELELSSRR